MRCAVSPLLHAHALGHARRLPRQHNSHHAFAPTYLVSLSQLLEAFCGLGIVRVLVCSTQAQQYRHKHKHQHTQGYCPPGCEPSATNACATTTSIGNATASYSGVDPTSLGRVALQANVLLHTHLQQRPSAVIQSIGAGLSATLRRYWPLHNTPQAA